MRWLYQLLLLFPFFLGHEARADVVLGSDRNVPTDSMIVFFFVGHSNMSGRAVEYGTTNADSIALMYTTYMQTDANLWWYYINDAYNLLHETGAWIPVQGRLQRDYDTQTLSSSWADPVLPILKRLRAYYPAHHLGAVKVASGHLQLQTHLVNNSELHKIYYRTQLLEAIAALKGKVRFGGVFVMLGMLEKARNPSMVGHFANDMDDLMDAVRNAANDATIPLLVADLELGARNTWLVAGDSVADVLRTQIAATPSTIAHTAVINTDWSACADSLACLPIYQDDHHYNRAGYMKFAESAVDAYLSISTLTPYCKGPSYSCAPVYTLISPSSSSAGISSSSLPLSSSSGPSSSSTAAYTFNRPLAGDIVFVGDTLHLQWTTDLDQVSEAYPEASLDSGRTWLDIGLQASVLPSDEIWEDIPWIVPKTMVAQDGGVLDVVNKKVMFRLTTYSGTAKASTSVLVLQHNTVPIATGFSLRVRNDRLYLGVASAWTLSIMNAQGRIVLTQSGLAGFHNVELHGLPPGAYFVNVGDYARTFFLER